MAAKILAACNLQQEPGAVSWYVPVVVDQSIQAKPVICIALILLIHGKRQFLRSADWQASVPPRWFQ